MIGIPLMGLPGLVVSTGLVGQVSVGVQLVAARFRERSCRPPALIDPVGMK